jgi:hypothetical protein
MTLLFDVQVELATALNSLGDRTGRGIEDLYCFHASAHINISVDGFILLRRNDRLDSARLLVRPAMETMLRLRAVRAKPHLVYRVLYSETIENTRWFSAIGKRHDLPYIPEHQRPEWLEFRARCEAQFGCASIHDTTLTVYDAARETGVESYYDSHYRAYCKFTHGALQAITGDFDEITDPEDTRVMLQCGITALDALAAVGAEIPNLESLTSRFAKLTELKPQALVREKSRT